MNTRLSVLALSAILVAGMAVSPSYAQSEQLEVATDKDSYSDGETVMITGQVGTVIRGFPVAMTVLAPNGNVVGINQLDVSPDGTFSSEITAGGNLWRAAGDYIVSITYGEGSGQRVAMTTFTFGGSAGGGSGSATPGQTPEEPPMPMQAMGSLLPPGAPTMALPDPDSNVMLGYSITGGSLTSITPDMQSTSIIIDINAASDGNLIIDFPRDVLDARLGDDMCSGGDDSFIVLVDLEERTFEESSTDTLRSLSIPFDAGAAQIEIIGTCIIPEFGTIAVMILAVAIVSIVALTARSRLGIMPSRY